MRVAVVGICLGIAALLLASTANFSVGQDEKKPKYSIKEVMKKAHAGGPASLRAKVLSKTASDEEKEQLIELYTSLAAGTPPEGEEKEFRAVAKKILAAAKGAVKGDEKSIKQLTKLTTCAACHKKFK